MLQNYTQWFHWQNVLCVTLPLNICTHTNYLVCSYFMCLDRSLASAVSSQQTMNSASDNLQASRCIPIHTAAPALLWCLLSAGLYLFFGCDLRGSRLLAAELPMVPCAFSRHHHCGRCRSLLSSALRPLRTPSPWKSRLCDTMHTYNRAVL